MNTLVAQSTSAYFMDSVRQAIVRCVDDNKSGEVIKDRDNNHSGHAIPAYVLSVCALEAFINETIARHVVRNRLKSLQLKKDELEKWEIRQKYTILPLLLWSKSFQRGQEPFQSFDTLLRIRNDLVHYKMTFYRARSGPKYLGSLEAKTVLLADKDLNWLERICITKGAIWAYNSACQMVHELAKLADNETQRVLKRTLKNFAKIPQGASKEEIGIMRVYPSTVRRKSRAGNYATS